MISDLTVKLAGQFQNVFGKYLMMVCYCQHCSQFLSHTEKPGDDILVTRSDLKPRSSSPNPPDRSRPGTVPLTGVFVNCLCISIEVTCKS